MLNEESEPLGLWVSWVETKIQTFNDILSVPVCGEDVEVTERFSYLGSDIHVSAGCEPEVETSGSGLGNHGFTGSWGVVLPLPVREDESPSLQVLGAPVLLYGCETWTLTMDLRRRLNSFGNRCLRRILGNRWSLCPTSGC